MKAIFRSNRQTNPTKLLKINKLIDKFSQIEGEKYPIHHLLNHPSTTANVMYPKIFLKGYGAGYIFLPVNQVSHER